MSKTLVSPEGGTKRQQRIIEGYFPTVKPGAPLAPTLGPVAVAWMEANMTLGEGDWYGQPMRLLPWMKKVTYHLLELVDDELPDGTPWMKYRYKRALIGLPKGSGKGPFLASLSAFFGFGPSQFDGWDDNGNPKGKIRPSPIVQVSAASYKQAGLLFMDIAQGVSNSPTLGEHADVYQGQVRLKGRPGVVERVHSTIQAAEGSRPTVVLKDELHEWQGPAKAHVSTVLDNGLAKRRDSMSLAISTAGPVGGDYDKAICRALYNHGVKVHDGLVEDDAFLFFWAECLTDYDLDDPVERRKAVMAASPSAGEPFFDVDAIVSEYDRVQKSDWERYRLNRWVEGNETWLPRGAWKACYAPEVEPLGDGEPVVLAVDGSWSNDATALLACSTDREVPHVELINEWRAPDGWRGDYHVPIAEVEHAIVEAASKFRVREVVADPARFGRSIDVLAVEHRLPMVVFPQSAARMVPATSRLYEAILNGTITHDGDARLAAALGNAVPKVGTSGVQLTKSTTGAKIDAAVALIMAFDRAHATLQETEVNYFDIDDLLADDGDDDPRAGGW